MNYESHCQRYCQWLFTYYQRALAINKIVWYKELFFEDVKSYFSKKRGVKMFLTMLKSKIHRATVTQSDLNYVGSITIDKALMDAAGLLEYEKVQVADIDNGNRFETYVIVGEENSGCICLNGAAAKCVEVGDRVIIMAYAQMTPEENEKHLPKVVFVNDKNEITEIANFEKHGEIK